MQVVKGKEFVGWLNRLRDRNARVRIDARLLRAQRTGHMGVTKSLGGGLYEMKMDFGPGYRVYYAVRGTVTVYLLGGGDKDSQVDDIQIARELLKIVMEEEWL